MRGKGEGKDEGTCGERGRGRERERKSTALGFTRLQSRLSRLHFFPDLMVPQRWLLG